MIDFLEVRKISLTPEEAEQISRLNIGDHFTFRCTEYVLTEIKDKEPVWALLPEIKNDHNN
jgi:hypothetical protein